MKDLIGRKPVGMRRQRGKRVVSKIFRVAGQADRIPQRRLANMGNQGGIASPGGIFHYALLFVQFVRRHQPGLGGATADIEPLQPLLEHMVDDVSLPMLIEVLVVGKTGEQRCIHTVKKGSHLIFLRN